MSHLRNKENNKKYWYPNVPANEIVDLMLNEIVENISAKDKPKALEITNSVMNMLNEYTKKK